MTDKVIRILVPGLQGRPGRGFNIRGLIADAVAADGDDIWAATSAGPVRISLPDDPPVSALISIYCDGPHPVTIDPGEETIQGAAGTIDITDGMRVTLRYLFGTWKRENGAVIPPAQPIALRFNLAVNSQYIGQVI